MARRRRNLEQRGRVPQRRAYGKYVGQGPIASDDITGWKFPVKDMVRQCGLLVSNDHRDGSLNQCEEADRPLCCARTTVSSAAASPPAYAALLQPLCLYHFDSPGVGFLGDSGTKAFHLSLEVLEEG